MEKEILDYIGSAYLIYNHNEQFIEAHPKVSQYLTDLNFKETDFYSLGRLLTSLEGIQLDYRDKAAAAILKERAIVQSGNLFSGIVASNNHIFMVHAQKKNRGAFAIFSDVTNEYQYIDRAGAYPRDFIQSQKIEALGNMAEGVAHDLNNVLSIIKGYARMLEWDKDLANNTKEKVTSIVKAVDRGSRLTHQILDFGAGKQHQKEILNLGDLIENQKMLLRPLLNKDIEMITEVDSDIQVECSPDHIFQVLMNLIVNARDAMEDGGKIKVSLKMVYEYELPFIQNERDKADGYCCLSVEDQGCGMTEEVKRRMFDSYYTTKEEGKGTGMGMAVIKSIARDLGAHIEIVSAPNEGATIQMFIPVQSHNRMSEFSDTRIIEEATLKTKTILIVENDDDLRIILSSSFADKGMIVLVAKDGSEALDIEKQCRGDIDFLLSDVVLPNLNGADLAVAFQTLRPTTQIFMISGYPANAIPEDIHIPRGMSIITKPVDLEDLEQKMLSTLPSISHKEESLSNMAGIA